jgi:hypothetical protein
MDKRTGEKAAKFLGLGEHLDVASFGGISSPMDGYFFRRLQLNRPLRNFFFSMAIAWQV